METDRGLEFFPTGGNMHVNLDHVVMLVDHGGKIELHMINGTVRTVYTNVETLRAKLGLPAKDAEKVA
jgi:hypothetical protein